MEDRELDLRVKGAFEGLTPDVFDSVLADCRRQKGRVMAINRPRRARKLLRRAAGLAAALLLLIGGVSAAGLWRLEHTAVASVSLDVNPSVEIKVNEKEKVVSVTALNEDGQKIISNMDFEGSSLEVTVNALIGSMLRQGYLSVSANSLLVSVESGNDAQAAALEQRLREEIGSLLEGGGISGAVLSQQVNADEELRALAEEYGLSLGKAQLIRELAAQDSRYSFADLAGLNVNDLNLLAQGLELKGVQRSGEASEGRYIGTAAAIDAALSDAGLSGEDISAYFSRMDWADGRMIYELDFADADGEYRYQVEALTGQILDHARTLFETAEQQTDDLVDILQQHADSAMNILEEQTGSMEDLVKEQNQSLEEWLSGASGNWAEWIRNHDEEIKRWAKENGELWEAWAKQYGGDWEAWAKDHAAEIESWARAQGRIWESYGELWESWAESIFG